jgi:outer membrane protein assembly factor BamB
MYKNMARGFAVVAAGAVLSAAGISAIGTPGTAATAAPMAGALSGRVSGRPPVRGAQLWVTLYSGPRTTDNFPSSVAVSPGGGTVFVAGTTTRAGSGTGRGSFATVAYKAATGARLWARSYRGPGNGFDRAASMAVSGGTVFVTGSSAASDGGPGNYATIAYNAATGTRLWASSYSGPGNSDDAAASMAVSPRGGRVFVTGCTAVFSSGDVDYATVAYNAATGTRLWARSYDRGGTSGGCATSVAAGPGGGRVFVTGAIDNNYATVAYNAATGAQLWARPYPGLRNPGDPIGTVLVAVSGGEVLVTGTTLGARSIDYGTVAYSAATGAQLWAKHYSNGRGPSVSNPRSMAVSGGKVFVTGTSITAGSAVSDYATVGYNAATGAQLWVGLYQGPGSVGNDPSSVAISPTGRTVYVTGTSATGPNGGDYATIAYNPATGARLWVRRYLGHGPFGNDASSVVVSPRGGQVFVTGTRYAPTTGPNYPASSYATIAYRG